MARPTAPAAEAGVMLWVENMGIDTSLFRWCNRPMGEMRKITVDVDERVLEAARAEGAGVAETVREALRELAHRRACARLLALKGKVKVDLDLNELRKDKGEE